MPSAGPRWRRIQKTIIGTLKDTKGENFLKEEVEIWVRDIVEVIQELIGNTTFGNKLVFVPQQVNINGDPTMQKIDEMWTGDWWMRIQVLLILSLFSIFCLFFYAESASSRRNCHSNYLIV